MGSMLALSQTSVTTPTLRALTPSQAGKEDLLLRSPNQVPFSFLSFFFQEGCTQAEWRVQGPIWTEQFQTSNRVLRVLKKPSYPGRYLQKEPGESQPLNSASLLWSWRLPLAFQTCQMPALSEGSLAPPLLACAFMLMVESR